MLFSTFHVHAALKLAPILPQNRKKSSWCALSVALAQKQAPFLFRYFNNNNASFQLQFYYQRRRRLYHTLLWHGCRGRWTKCLCKKCGYFLSHRTLKIPSSINKPVPCSKIVGKTEQEKMHEFSNHCCLVNVSTASATWTIILMSASSPCNRRIIDRVGLMLWICTGIFSFHHAIQFPVERFAMRSLRRSKRLDNEEAEFHFPWQTISPAVNCKI